MKNTLYRTLLVLSGLSFLAVLLLFISGNYKEASWSIIIACCLLLAGIQGYPRLKSFSFTACVVTAAAVSMVFPSYITEVNGYNTEGLIVPLIQLIMFGMGTTMGLKDFAQVLKMPKGVIIGLLCQFTIMPILAVALTILLSFPAEIAVGVLLIGCSPSGVSSNIMAFLAKGNLALSITLTSFATLFAPLVTPLLMQLLAGQLIPIDVYGMMVSILYMIFLPVIAGLLFNRVFRGRAAWLHTSMPVVAMTANVVIIAVIVAAGRDSLLVIGPLLLLAAMIHNAAGYFLGYWSGRLFKMSKSDCRTISIEVGMQNGGMAAGIASDLGRAATMGLYPAIFGTWMDISGSFLANWWRRVPTGDETSPAATESIPEAIKIKT